jgi:hypothetical protein
MLRKSIAALSALLLTVGVTTFVATAASAHTPKVSATCTALSVDLKDYQTRGGKTNHVKVTQAGDVVADVDFGASYKDKFNFANSKVNNTWEVKVTAWDDPTGSQGFTKTFSGTTADCAPPADVHKVQICHATASTSHPYANGNQWVSWSAVDNTYNKDWNGHGDHDGDIIPPFADFPGSNWDAAGQAIWNNDCKVPTPKVVPEDPTIVDVCGTANDDVQLATTAGVTYSVSGNKVVATLDAGYQWGPTPKGWLSSNGKLTYKFSLSSESCYVVVAWDMRKWDGTHAFFPQNYVMHENQTTPDIDALDDELNAIGYGCYQIDVYYDDATTTALIAGGVLNGPNDPAEHLAWPGAYKILRVGDSCNPTKPQIERGTESKDSQECSVPADGTALRTTQQRTWTQDWKWSWQAQAWVKLPKVFTPWSIASTTTVDDETCIPGQPELLSGDDSGQDELCAVPQDGTKLVTTWTQHWTQSSSWNPATHAYGLNDKVYQPKVYGEPTTVLDPTCGVDVCVNIDNFQGEIPEGMQLIFNKDYDTNICATPPTLEGSLFASECVDDVPWISYDVKLDDPYGVSTDDGTATFTFTADDSSESYVKTVAIGAGKFLWPGATATDDGDGTYTATGWPGWDFVAGTWVAVGDNNYGWTRNGVNVHIEVNPEMDVTLSYPPPTALCVAGPPTEIHNELDAPPAEAVVAEAQFAG